MNLEEFKVASDEQLKAYGELIPLGRIYDTNNNKQLTYKGSDGYWREYTYDTTNNLLTYKDSKGYWDEYTYNSNNNILTSKKSNGYWGEYTYDFNNNNILAYKDSTGYWAEYTYDSNNNKLTYKDSTGVNRVGLIKGVNHTLWYDIDSNKYVAGCTELSYKECIEFYEEFKDEHEDSNLFLETIKKHNLTLGK